MAYEQTMTTGELLAAVTDNLRLEGADVAGLDPAGIARALNAAARRLADELALAGRGELQTTITRSVAQGDADVDLPDGSDEDEPLVRRFLTVTFARTGGSPAPLHLFDGRAVLTHPDLAWRGSLALAWEGLTLRWLAEGGAPLAGTLTLTYAAALPAVNATARDATVLELLPPDYGEVVVDAATARLLPAAHPARERYEIQAATTLQRLLMVAINKVSGAGAAARTLGAQR